MPTAQSGFFDWVLFILRTYGPLFLRGAGTTLLLALSGTFVGFMIGLAIGSVRAIPLRRIRCNSGAAPTGGGFSPCRL